MKPQTIRPWYRFWDMIWLLLAAVLFSVCGCVDGQYYEYSRPYRLERDYGVSVANNMAQQKAHPGAVDQRPALGMPPVAAQNAQIYYDKGFEKAGKEEKPAPIIQLTVGK